MARESNPSPSVTPTIAQKIRADGFVTVDPSADDYLYYSNPKLEHITLHAQPAWVVSFPDNAGPLPTAPVDHKQCGAIHDWYHNHGAIDMGGTIAVINLRATRENVELRNLHFTVRATRTGQPYEGLSVACTQTSYVPSHSQLAFEFDAFYNEHDGGSAVLDESLRRGSVVPNLPTELDIQAGDSRSIIVQAQARFGVYQWVVAVDGLVNGTPFEVTASDRGTPFETNSGFRTGWFPTARYVICSFNGSTPHLQEYPFVC